MRAASAMAAAGFAFLDVPRLFTLVDHELELVEPEPRYAADLLAACHHPLTKELMPVQASLDRKTVDQFLAQNPRGHSPADPVRQVAPGYTFWMRIRPLSIASPAPAPSSVPAPDVAVAGSISLRIGHSLNLDHYLGHIGYHVLPPARGHHFAERAARMILPIARAHGHQMLWITCNPDNLASRRTCERLGAVFVDTVSLPKDNPLYTQGDRLKCRYRLDI